MFRITKEFCFEAAHQLLPGCFTAKCSDCIHGHSYRAIVTLASEDLNKHGMVVDFGELKFWLNELDNLYDHALLLPRALQSAYDTHNFIIRNKKVRWLTFNPTAENLAYEIFHSGKVLFPQLESVTLFETATCSATYSEPVCCGT